MFLVLTGATVLFILLILGIATWYLKQVYLDYQPAVDDLISDLPESEANPPAALGELVRRFNGDGFRYLVCRLAMNAVMPQGHQPGDRQIRLLLWQYLLPGRIGSERMLALYAHLMPFEDGRGLEHGARRHYDKSPAELTQRELLELYVISIAPEQNSPFTNAERFEQESQRYWKSWGKEE